MKKQFLTILFLVLLSFLAVSQTENRKDYRNFPLTLSIQFHAFSMPFKNFKTNFQNIGIGLGTEVSHSSKHNWVQEFSLIWVRNKTIGNGLFFLTQAAWRPYLSNPVFGEFKAGIGYHLAFRPRDSFKMVDGKWESVGKKGKGMLAIPLGIGLGMHHYSENIYTSPFINYQFMLLKGFNKTVPIIPETLIQLGTRTHFNSQTQ